MVLEVSGDPGKKLELQRRIVAEAQKRGLEVVLLDDEPRVLGVKYEVVDAHDVIRRYAFGDFTVNFDERQVNRNGRSIDLTATEMRILEMFMQRPDRLLSKEDIYLKLWGDDERDERTIDSHVSHLRIKTGLQIVPRYGQGYIFNPPSTSQE